MSEVEELDIRAQEFIGLADEIDIFSLQAKRAFVARDSVQNHAARMHKILWTQRNISIFQLGRGRLGLDWDPTVPWSRPPRLRTQSTLPMLAKDEGQLCLSAGSELKTELRVSHAA